MNHSATIGGLLCACVAVSASAVPTYYGNRGAFNAANPGLALEDFENLNVGAVGGVSGCASPLNSTTGPGGTCWDVGDVIPGFTLVDQPGPDSAGIVVTGSGVAGSTSRGVGANSFADSLALLLAGGVTSVGVDLASRFDAGNVVVSLFDGANALIDSVVVAASTGGTFWGVRDLTTPIHRITFGSTSNQAEFVDNLAFGTVSAVPEPATLLLLGLGIAGLGLRRR